jgi:hypothetical protein
MPAPDARAPIGGHEPDAPALRGIVIGAGSILGMVLVAVVVAVLLVRATTPPPSPAPPPFSGDTRLSATPQADIAAFRRDKERLLREYAWVDRAHGIVRIPIEQAMALLVAQQARRDAAR